MVERPQAKLEAVGIAVVGCYLSLRLVKEVPACQPDQNFTSSYLFPEHAGDAFNDLLFFKPCSSQNWNEPSHIHPFDQYSAAVMLAKDGIFLKES